MFCCAQFKNHALLWFNKFLRIILFSAIINEIIFLILFLDFYCWYIEMQWTFVCWSCILHPCWIHLLVLMAFFIGFLSIFCIRPCNMQKQFCFFLPNLEDLYFLLLTYWYGLESLGGRVVIFVLLFSLREKYLVSAP